MLRVTTTLFVLFIVLTSSAQIFPDYYPDELKDLFGRDVDLVSRQGIERSNNYIRRREIIDSARVIYAAS